MKAAMTASVAPDTSRGILDSIFETLLKTEGSKAPQSVDEKPVPPLAETLWSVLRVLVLIFLALRLASWAVRAGARSGWRGAQLLQRIWLMAEGSAWAITVVWVVTRVASKESTGAAVMALLVVILLIGISWTALLDVAAGIMLAAERPFVVGDAIRVQHNKSIIEGQIRVFRSRVMELETLEGHRVRLLYRWVSGLTRVRPGGSRTAHAVTVTLELPESVDPTEAVRYAEELACSSPWAVLGMPVQVEWRAESPAGLNVEAYAFSKDARVLLQANLVSGWKDIMRKLKSTDTASRVP